MIGDVPRRTLVRIEMAKVTEPGSSVRKSPQSGERSVTNRCRVHGRRKSQENVEVGIAAGLILDSPHHPDVLPGSLLRDDAKPSHQSRVRSAF
jgi:hypothetical protein